MRIPDTFIFVDRRMGRGSAIKAPMVTISIPASSPTRVQLNRSLQDQLKLPAGAETFWQVHISASTLKLTQCAAGAKGARRLNASWCISVPELRPILDLPEGVRHVCKAEVVHNKSAIEIWATYPRELLEHIEQVNGAAR